MRGFAAVLGWSRLWQMFFLHAGHILLCRMRNTNRVQACSPRELALRDGRRQQLAVVGMGFLGTVDQTTHWLLRTRGRVAPVCSPQ